MENKDQNDLQDTNVDFEISQKDLEPSAADIANKPSTLEMTKKHPPHKRIWNWTKSLSNKQKVALVFGLLLLIGLACAGTLWALNNLSKPLSGTAVKTDTEVQSKLTGLTVTADVNERQVTAVMIENSPDARPQSGLIDAGVVYEAEAEGGITRFLTLFQDTGSDYLGPVRSVRPYYLDWLVPYDAAVGHVGGSGQALAEVQSQNIKDLDQFSNPSAYDRVDSRYAPHNVYTSTKRLDEIENQRGYTKSTFEGLTRDRKERPPEVASINKIQLSYKSPIYNVSYSYDKTTNSYKRVLGGVAHKDERSGKQISPKVVIAMEMQRTQAGIYSFLMSQAQPGLVGASGIRSKATRL